MATSFWVSNGTAQGTTMIEDINPGSGDGVSSYGASYQKPLVYEGILYFAANDGTHGDELWQTDGTAANTKLVANINPGSGSSDPQPYTILNGQLLVYADDGIHGKELMEDTLNLPPTIAPIAAQAVTVTEPLSFDVLASEPSFPSETLTYSLQSGAPQGAVINGMTGVLTWTPSSSVAPGIYEVTVVVSNNGVGSLERHGPFPDHGQPAQCVADTGPTPAPDGG